MPDSLGGMAKARTRSANVQPRGIGTASVSYSEKARVFPSLNDKTGRETATL